MTPVGSLVQFTINQRHFTWSRNACVPNDQWFAPDDDRWRLCIDYRFWSSPITTLAANNKPMEFRVQSSFLLGKSAKAILKVKLQWKNFLHIFLAPFPIKSRIPFKSLRKKYAYHCFMFKRLYVKAICHHGMSSRALRSKFLEKLWQKLVENSWWMISAWCALERLSESLRLSAVPSCQVNWGLKKIWGSFQKLVPG